MKKIYPFLFAFVFASLHAWSQCSPATGFSHTNITPWSADIVYTAYAANDLIEIGIGNFTPGINNTAGQGGSIVYIGSVATTIDFLYGSVTYTYYIRKYCGSNTWSANSVVGTFTTAPCFAMNFQGYGVPHTMNFSGRGYIDSYGYSCSGTYGTYYGKENILQFQASHYSFIVDVDYINPTNHPITYSLRVNPEGLGFCDPTNTPCKDRLTVSPGTTRRYYSVDIPNPSSFYTMLTFDIDDSATYSVNAPSVSVYVTVGCGDPGTINASASTICQGTSVTLTPSGGTIPQGSTYNWYTGSCGQTWYGSSSSLTVSPNVTTTYYARLEGPCGFSGCVSKTITVSNYPYAFISSTTCAPGVVSQLTANNSVPPYTFQWRRNSAMIPGATGASYIPGATGNYDCLVSNLCATNTSQSILVNAFGSLPVAQITYPYNPPQYCPGSFIPLSVTSVAGQSYQWKFNGTPISGATNSTYNANMNGNFVCDVTNVCGTVSSSSINVNPTPVPVLTPISSTTFCPGGSVTINVSMSTSGQYNWSRDGIVIPGATNGQYTATQSGVYTWTYYPACGTVTSNGITVTVTSTPYAAITTNSPSTIVCSPNIVSLRANTGTGYTYQWRRNGINITGTSFSYAANVSGSYDCIVTSPCGSATSNAIVATVFTGPPVATISAAGSTAFCGPGSVTLNATSGTGLTYQWQANGTPVSGATNSTYVATAAGSFICIVSNSCGSSTSNAIIVTTNAAPAAAGAITGQSSGVCLSSKTYSVAAIANATSYSWTAPPGSSITSGQGTTSITISFTSGFSSGTISVAGSNSCGSGSSSSLSVIAIPAQPGTITGAVSVCHNQNNVIYTIAIVAGATSYTWTVPPGASIKTGQGTRQIKVRYGNSAGLVTVKANNSCGSGAVRSVTIAMPCRDESEAEDEMYDVRVYPNPFRHDFTLEINSSPNDLTTISIFDLTGRQIETHQAAVRSLQCGENLPAGIYLLEVISGENRKMVKLIKEGD